MILIVHIHIQMDAEAKKVICVEIWSNHKGKNYIKVERLQEQRKYSLFTHYSQQLLDFNMIVITAIC